MNEEIKPCPYCGANAKAESSSGAWMVFCDNASEGCSLGFVDTESTYYEEAIIKWNTRPLEEKLQKENEELKVSNNWNELKLLELEKLTGYRVIKLDDGSIQFINN